MTLTNIYTVTDTDVYCRQPGLRKGFGNQMGSHCPFFLYCTLFILPATLVEKVTFLAQPLCLYGVCVHNNKQCSIQWFF